FAGWVLQTNKEGRVRVAQVAAGKPAEAGGVKAGDIVLATNGAPPRSLEDLKLAISERPGKRILLTLERDGQKVDTSFVTTAEDRFFPLPRASERVARRVYSATWLAISGNFD